VFEQGEFNDAIIVGRQSEELHLNLFQDTRSDVELLLTASELVVLQAKSHESLSQSADELAAHERAINYCRRAIRRTATPTISKQLTALMDATLERLSEVGSGIDNKTLKERITLLQQSNTQPHDEQSAPSEHQVF